MNGLKRVGSDDEIKEPVDNDFLNSSHAAKPRDSKGRFLQAAIIFSVLGKFSSSIVQLIAIPFAAREIGTDEYSYFLVMGTLGSFFSLLVLNYGPRLVSRAAICKSISALFSRVILITSLNCLIALLLALYSIWILDVSHIIAPDRFEMNWERSRWFVSVISTVNVALCFLSVIEAFQLGLLQSHTQSIFLAISSLATIPTVCFAVTRYPSAEMLFLASIVPMVLGRCANAVLFISLNRAILRNDLIMPVPGASSDSSSMQIRETIKDGFAFTLTATVAAFSANQLPILIFTYFENNDFIAPFGILQVLIGVCLQPIALVLTPFLPVFVLSLRERDSEWIRKWTLAGFFSLALYSASIAGILVTCGTRLVSFWSPSTHLESSVLPAFCFYIVSLFFEAYIFHLCHAFTRIHLLYKLYLARIVLTFLGSIAAGLYSELCIFYAVAGLATCFFSVFLGGLLFMHCLRANISL